MGTVNSVKLRKTKICLFEVSAILTSCPPEIGFLIGRNPVLASLLAQPSLDKIALLVSKSNTVMGQSITGITERAYLLA